MKQFLIRKYSYYIDIMPNDEHAIKKGYAILEKVKLLAIYKGYDNGSCIFRAYVKNCVD